MGTGCCRAHLSNPRVPPLVTTFPLNVKIFLHRVKFIAHTLWHHVHIFDLMVHSRPSSALAAILPTTLVLLATVINAQQPHDNLNQPCYLDGVLAAPEACAPPDQRPPHLQFTAANPAPQPAYLAICTAIKDQHLDIREWIFYHRAIGVQRFYLVDTGSTPPMQATLQDYIDIGLVHYTHDNAIPWRPGTHGPQITIYENCIQNFGNQHSWMAFIDADEFLIVKDPTVPDLTTLLMEYEDDAGLIGGLAVNWVVFGSSGLEKRPLYPSTLSNYWKCAPEQHPENCHIKSIVRPSKVANTTTDPHHFKYVQPYKAVNTRRETIPGPKSKSVAPERLLNFHYAVKSKEDFSYKMARGSGMGNLKTMAYLEYVDNYTTAECWDAIDLGMDMQEWAVY